MAKEKYRFNPDSLSYERVEAHNQFFKKILINFVLISFIIGISVSFLNSSLFDTGKVQQLTIENQRLRSSFKKLNSKVLRMSSVLAEIEKSDSVIYRKAFGMNARVDGGTGGSDNLRNYRGISNSKDVQKTSQRVDNLLVRLKIQLQSFNEVINEVSERDDRLAHTPAIQPVPSNKLNHSPYGYGPRIDPVYKTPAFHYGMDFSANIGTPVYATADGVVSRADNKSRGFGNHIRIEHGFNYKTLYAHLSKILVRPGQKVKRGTLIGLVGNTGKSVGPHLHYEVHFHGSPVNPIDFYFNDLTPQKYDALVRQTLRGGYSLD